MNEVKMKGNLGKSILQTAGQFSEPSGAVWEYVSNSIEYRSSHDGTKISVTIDKDSIEISDNSDGMDAPIIESFFTFAGENLARQGRQVSLLKRGQNGTGKIAAFGIGDELIVETVRNNIKNKFKLTRKDILDSPDDSSEIPVQNLISNEKTKESNGTRIKIGKLNTKPDLKRLIRKISREITPLKSYDIEILVNGVVCEPKQIEIQSTYVFKSEGEIHKRYGDFEAKIYISKYPLDKYDAGIKVLCRKSIIGIDDFGIGSLPQGEYITGEIDIDGIDEKIDNIVPFDQSRSQKLNTNHAGVRELTFFLGPKLEKLRKELVDQKNEEKSSARNKKLEKLGEDLSSKLNKQWNNIKRKIDVIRGGSNAKSYLSEVLLPGEDKDLEAYSEGIGVSVGSEEEIRIGDGKHDDPPTDRAQKTFKNSDGDKEAEKSSGSKARKRNSGFSIIYENLGESEHKSLYKKDDLQIVINLDHPTTSACLKGCNDDVENITFKRFYFEAVCREFEHAIAQEMISDEGSFPPEDVLSEMRFHYDSIVRNLSSDFYRIN